MVPALSFTDIPVIGCVFWVNQELTPPATSAVVLGEIWDHSRFCFAPLGSVTCTLGHRKTVRYFGLEVIV